MDESRERERENERRELLTEIDKRERERVRERPGTFEFLWQLSRSASGLRMMEIARMSERDRRREHLE